MQPTKNYDQSIRWGILGNGNIAHQFVSDLEHLPDAEPVAIASRNREKTETFAKLHQIPNVLSSPEELARSDVDIIYIGTLSHTHAPFARTCLEHGKSVLCEKPLTTNLSEARSLVALAEESGLLLMEGMWMRFIPAVKRFIEMAHEGVIGEPRLLRADFSFRSRFDKTSRLFDPAQGGGALFDVGVYPIALALLLFGEPESVSGLAHIGESDVDEQASISLRFPNGQLTSLTAATRTSIPCEAWLYGTAGHLQLPCPFFSSKRLIHHPRTDPDKIVEPAPRNAVVRLTQKLRNRLRHPRGKFSPRNYYHPYPGGGYQFQAKAIGESLRGGHKTPPYPSSLTLSTLSIIEQVLAQSR